MIEHIGGWFILFLLVQIALFEWWSTVTGNQTISMWWWWFDVNFWWARLVYIGGNLALAWHLHLFRTPKL